MITQEKAALNSKMEFESQDDQVDLNLDHKSHLRSKSFFDQTIKNVLLKTKERPSLLKKSKDNRMSVNKISLDHFDSAFKGIRFSKNLNANSFHDAKRISVNNISLDHFDSAFKGIRISKNLGENTLRKTNRMSVNNISLNDFNSAFKGIRFSKNLEFDDIKNKKRISVNNISLNEFDSAFKDVRFSKKIEAKKNHIDQRISLNNIKLNDFDSAFKGIRLSRNLEIKDLNEIKSEMKSKQPVENIVKNIESNDVSNLDNQCNKFTKDFLSDRVRKTITALRTEDISLTDDNFNNNCNLFSKDFFNQKVRKTITHIETETKDKGENNKNYDCNEFSKSFLRDKFRNTITKIDKEIESKKQVTSNSEFNRKKSIITPTGGLINETLKRISSTIDQKVEQKLEAEKKRKSDLIEIKLLSEKLLIEKEVESGKANSLSNSFFRKSCTGTLQKINEEQEKLVKYVIRIQTNFRRSLWRFIIKLELMNLRIQKENERAIEASKNRKRVISISAK